MQQIWIWIPIWFTKMDGFKSPSKIFKSHMMKELKLKATNLNLWNMDSNLSWRTSEKIEAGFQSLIQRFESLDLELWRTSQSDWIFKLWIRIPSPKMKLRLKVRQKDLNLWVMDSNTSLAQNSNFIKAIRIPYIEIRISFSVEALNARPATPTTRFSNPISLTTAS